MIQVSSSSQIPGHSKSTWTADHCHHHRRPSSGAASSGTCGTCGGPGSSRSRSWGRSLKRLEEDCVLGSLGGTWGRGTWEGAGTAAGSAGRTSRREVGKPEQNRNETSTCQRRRFRPLCNLFVDPFPLRPIAPRVRIRREMETDLELNVSTSCLCFISLLEGKEADRLPGESPETLQTTYRCSVNGVPYRQCTRHTTVS